MQVKIKSKLFNGQRFNLLSAFTLGTLGQRRKGTRIQVTDSTGQTWNCVCVQYQGTPVFEALKII